MEFELDKDSVAIGVVEIVQIEVLPPPAVVSDVISANVS